jgi:hypothetical protein
MAQDFIQCWLDAIAGLEAAERNKIIKLLRDIENRTTGSGQGELLTALCQAEKQIQAKVAYLQGLISQAAAAIVNLENTLNGKYCPEVSTLKTVIEGASAIAALELLDQQRSLTGLQLTMGSLDGKVSVNEALGKQAAQFRELMEKL